MQLTTVSEQHKAGKTDRNQTNNFQRPTLLLQNLSWPCIMRLQTRRNVETRTLEEARGLAETKRGNEKGQIMSQGKVIDKSTITIHIPVKWISATQRNLCNP